MFFQRNRKIKSSQEDSAPSFADKKDFFNTEALTKNLRQLERELKQIANSGFLSEREYKKRNEKLLLAQRKLAKHIQMEHIRKNKNSLQKESYEQLIWEHCDLDEISVGQKHFKEMIHCLKNIFSKIKNLDAYRQKNADGRVFDFLVAFDLSSLRKMKRKYQKEFYLSQEKISLLEKKIPLLFEKMSTYYPFIAEEKQVRRLQRILFELSKSKTKIESMQAEVIKNTADVELKKRWLGLQEIRLLESNTLYNWSLPE